MSGRNAVPLPRGGTKGESPPRRPAAAKAAARGSCWCAGPSVAGLAANLAPAIEY